MVVRARCLVQFSFAFLSRGDAWSFKSPFLTVAERFVAVIMGFNHVSADVVFVIETTAVNGAYFNDLKSNYIIPTLE